jgi:hypothetical protein
MSDPVRQSIWSRPLSQTERSVLFGACGLMLLLLDTFGDPHVLSGTTIRVALVGKVMIAFAIVWFVASLAWKVLVESRRTRYEPEPEHPIDPSPVVSVAKFSCRTCGELTIAGKLDDDRVCDECRPEFVGGYR